MRPGTGYRTHRTINSYDSSFDRICLRTVFCRSDTCFAERWMIWGRIMNIKKTGIILAAAAVVIAAVLGIKSARSRAEEEKRRQVLMYKRIGYCDDLLIPNDPNDIVYTEEIKNFTVSDENSLYVRVKYYNYISGSNVTMEELIDSYRAFLNDDTEGEDAIQKFHVFRHADIYEVAKREMDEEEFFHKVNNALEERYGTDMIIRNATAEQLETAIDDVMK